MLQNCGPHNLGADVVKREPVNAPTIDRSNKSQELRKSRTEASRLPKILIPWTVSVRRSPSLSGRFLRFERAVLQRGRRSNRAVITVIDKNSGEIVRTLPSEEVSVSSTMSIN